VLPSTFTDVSSAQANMAGDGHGGTKMSFTMTLFGPIGASTAEFGYTATIRDGQVPPASISALPVSPLESPSFKGGAESYKGGASTGVDLTAGATEIDTNLLKLRDGAGDLLAGLIQLRDGANQLNEGLAGQAAPGAAQLAAGASDAATGADQLNDGLYKLNAGAKQLAAGADDAKDGAQKLAVGSKQVAGGLHEAGAKAPELIGGLTQVSNGLGQLDAGLATMSSSIGGLDAKAQPLRDGIAQLMAGIGSTSTPANTLLYGLSSTRTGLSDKALPGVQELKTQLGCAAVVLKDLRDGAAAGADPCYSGGLRPAMPASSGAPYLVLDGLLSQVGTSGDLSAATALGGLNLLAAGLDMQGPGTYGATDPGGAGYALAAVQCGVDNTSIVGLCDTTKPGVKQGISLVSGGISQLISEVTTQVQAGVGTPTSGSTTLRGGVAALQGGVSQISDGGNQLLAGLTKLGAGADQVAAGNGDLLAGLKQLSTGAGQLAAGAGDAKVGAGQLADGNRKISKGASDLSSGLNDAAAGSGQLADGLTTAAESAPQLKDGAQQLSDQGTKKIIEAGKTTAADYGEKYALIVAGAERAKTEGMAYGAPAGASGATAYSLELAGVDGEGSRNVVRGLGALALLGLGTGAAALVRRRIA
jgi:putative membrane protein